MLLKVILVPLDGSLLSERTLSYALDLELLAHPQRAESEKALVANYVLVSGLLPAPATLRVAIPYTLFKQQVDAGNVAAITASGDQIQGRFKQPVSYTAPNTSPAVQVTPSPQSS